MEIYHALLKVQAEIKLNASGHSGLDSVSIQVNNAKCLDPSRRVSEHEIRFLNLFNVRLYNQKE